MKIYWFHGKKNIIGDNLRLIRTSKNLTQEDVAVKLQLMGLELDRITVSRIENGIRFVPDYEVKLLADALDVSFNELLG